MSLFCQFCNYKTDDRRNYAKHLKSTKHLKNLDTNMSEKNDFSLISSIDYTQAKNKSKQITQNLQQSFECENCKILFKHQSSFSRHKKNCIKK